MIKGRLKATISINEGYNVYSKITTENRTNLQTISSCSHPESGQNRVDEKLFIAAT